MLRFIFFFSFFSISFLNGQLSPVDTLTQQDDQQYVKKKSGVFKGEPGKAALYSLIVPGGGQVYNKDYWKVPLVLAAEGAAVYNLIQNTQDYNLWNNCYLSIIDGDDSTYSCSSEGITQSTAFRIRNTARSNREMSYVFVGLAHLLNIVEAFVDRHLTLFDVSDDLSFFEPYPNIIQEPRVDFISINIPLNGK